MCGDTLTARPPPTDTASGMFLIPPDAFYARDFLPMHALFRLPNKSPSFTMINLLPAPHYGHDQSPIDRAQLGSPHEIPHKLLRMCHPSERPHPIATRASLQATAIIAIYDILTSIRISRNGLLRALANHRRFRYYHSHFQAVVFRRLCVGGLR